MRIMKELAYLKDMLRVKWAVKKDFIRLQWRVIKSHLLPSKRPARTPPLDF